MFATIKTLERLPEIDALRGVPQGIRHQWDVFDHTMSVVEYVAEGGFRVALAALFHDTGKPAVATPHPRIEGAVQFHGHEQVSEELTRVAMTREFSSYGTKLTDEVCFLVRHHMLPHMVLMNGITEKTVRRFKNKIPAHLIEELLLLSEADLTGHGFGRNGKEELAPLRAALYSL